MRRKSRPSLALGLLALVLAGCSSGDDGSESSAGGAGQEATSFLHIHGLGVDSAGTLYVATHGGLVKAAGEGRWIYASADRNDHMGFSLHPGAGVMYRSGHSPARPSLGVESSLDGTRWTHLADVADPPVDFHAMAVSFADAKTLWGWDSGGRGAFASTDGGTNWTRLQLQGIEAQLYVLAGPAQANLVLAGTISGLYRSADGGSAWRRVQGLGEGWAIAIGPDPKDARHWMVFAQRGMKATTDGGTTWSDAGGGLPEDAQITSLAISPLDADVAYAADASRIFQTKDAGTTWTMVRGG